MRHFSKYTSSKNTNSINNNSTNNIDELWANITKKGVKA